MSMFTIFIMFMSIFVYPISFSVSLNVGRIVGDVAVGVSATGDCGRVDHVGPDVLGHMYLQSDGWVAGPRSQDIAASTGQRGQVAGPARAAQGNRHQRVWHAGQGIGNGYDTVGRPSRCDVAHGNRVFAGVGVLEVVLMCLGDGKRGSVHAEVRSGGVTRPPTRSALLAR